MGFNSGFKGLTLTALTPTALKLRDEGLSFVIVLYTK
jgi:hypothetical protein